MRVIGVSLIEEFVLKHADVRDTLGAWTEEAKAAVWKGPMDIKAKYKSASFLGDNVVVFNIKGNGYRLVTKVAYQLGVVKIQRLGTHAEYTTWDL